ncbi:unnamed protein product [Ostreobium quekettii]|uniref:Uncharacterized protein n=1 Tax=Ostreobium quekettii TaxID=121088 RepID=A0A8S1IQ70_9CHLO|nr:unnamed protein product [Ostreobium quekettii]
MCSAFILTGNLAAPFTAQVVRQMLYSTYQRINYNRIAEFNGELQARLQGQAQELKLRLLKASVDKQLARSSALVEEERHAEDEATNGDPDENPTTSDAQGAPEISVDLKVLLTVLRMETSRTAVMIKEEMQRDDDSDRLKILNSQKDELSVLVKRVENEMAERDEDETNQESGK